MDNPAAGDPNERFRARREQARRRRRTRRVAALAAVVGLAAAVVLGARFAGDDPRPASRASAPANDAEPAAPPPPAPPAPTPVPDEIRGVHVTMALASVPGKLGEYLAYTEHGMNTLELDVKDESGDVAFQSREVPLATRIGAAKRYYDPEAAVRRAHARGLYVIGRIVVFEDPVLSEQRPALAIRTPDGGVWRNHAGLGWVNPYDERVWDYNLDIAEAAVRAGFDEIMFDYVRFPSDGDVAAAVFRGRVAEPKPATIARFLRYARGRLHPLDARVSAAVFGLSATREIGVGQRPRRLAPYLDAIYPMVYPSHYNPGEFGIADPNAAPGLTVGHSLRDFRRALRGTETRLVPWLQDFSLGRTYGLAEVQAQIAAARRRGSDGFLLWNAAGVYTVAALSPD